MATQLKKIGSDLEVKNIVIHQVLKDQGDRKTTLKRAEHLLQIANKEKLFVGKINNAYQKKSSPTYGIFGNENPRFREYLQQYLVDHDFYSFSIKSLEHYNVILKNTVPATGGFFIMTDFINKTNKQLYLLVLTINNKDGYVVSESDLTLKDIKNLDLNKVDIACLINISKWQDISSGIDKESKTYLSFTKGIKELSHYFMSFIDCDHKTMSSESTLSLIKALTAYSEMKNLDRDSIIRLKNEVFTYCLKCIEDNREIQLSTISAIINPDIPEEFNEMASQEEYGVSAIVSGDKSKLRILKYVSYTSKDKALSIEFDCNVLDDYVFYNEVKNELTIKDLPEELTKQIPRSNA